MGSKVKDFFYLRNSNALIFNTMKKSLAILAVLLCTSLGMFAQNPLNGKADSILGEYLVPDPGNDSKVRFTKNPDGSYNCQIFWLANNINPDNGQPWTDLRNPDKSLRNRRCDSIVIISNLKYDAARQVWNGAKIYDPNRGIKANVTCQFMPDGQLMLKGTVLGIGEKVYWKKLK